MMLLEVMFIPSSAESPDNRNKFSGIHFFRKWLGGAEFFM